MNSRFIPQNTLPAVAAGGAVPAYFQNLPKGAQMALGGGGMGFLDQSPGALAGPMAGIFGGLGGMLFDSQQTSPSEAASPYLNQIPGQVHQQLDPYAEAGKQAIPTLQDQYSGLLSHPEMLMSKIGSTFQQSPGYEWQKNQALGAINRSAAAGGMLGTPQNQQQAGEVAGQLANQDYYNYVGNILNLFNRGLTGTENMFGTGAQTAQSLAEQLTRALVGQANNAYEGQAASNKQGGIDMGALLQGAGALASFL